MSKDKVEKMSPEDLAYFKQLLMKKREEVIKNLEYLRTVVLESTTKEATGEHSSYSYHMADQGTDAMEREKAFLFAARDEKYLKLIGRERLEAVPTTTISVEAKLAEAKNK